MEPSMKQPNQHGRQFSIFHVNLLTPLSRWTTLEVRLNNAQRPCTNHFLISKFKSATKHDLLVSVGFNWLLILFVKLLLHLLISIYLTHSHSHLLYWIDLWVMASALLLFCLRCCVITHTTALSFLCPQHSMQYSTQ